MYEKSENKIDFSGVKLKHGIILAPMAGITDRTFRKLCKMHGCEYSISEMVCAKALCYEQLCKKKSEEYFKTGTLSKILRADLPMAIQLFGSEPEFISKAVNLILSMSYISCKSETMPSAIDINMGCPVRKIVSNGEGSALMKNIDLACSIAESAVNEAQKFGVPVTVKMRAGFDANHINCNTLAKALEGCGVAAIAVHGRTRSQLYSGKSNNEYIKMVKDEVKIPVIGNGDITDISSAKKMIEETGCDGIMIGRGAIGNPFIFDEISSFLSGKKYTVPSKKEIIDVAKWQVLSMIEEKGEKNGVAESKKHLSHYLKGFRGASEARCSLNSATNYYEIEQTLDKLLYKQNSEDPTN